MLRRILSTSLSSIMHSDKIRLSTVYLLLFALITSCAPYQTLVNFDESGDLSGLVKSIENYNPALIQPGDILSITVSSSESETVEVFNNNTDGYIVDNNGMINIPLIGNLLLAEKTIEEAKLEVSKALEKYFVVAPIVNLRISNFRINVNGEVSNPGSYVISNSKVNLIEAITLAGDFTPYSKRDEVLVIRENNGKRSFEYVNFNSIDMMNSPYFYLKQNDIIYVKPEKRIVGTVRTRQEKVLPYIAVSTSLILIIAAILNR